MECINCRHCNTGAFNSGKWYCNSPKVSVFNLPPDMANCFEEKQPSCHRHNMPNDMCYGKPYLKDGGVPKKCLDCKWFAFHSNK